MIIIVLGLPGSGKSYFASRLAQQLQAKYVNSDLIRNQLLDIKTYTSKEKTKVYTFMIDEMKAAIGQNTNIVIDATFYKKSIRNKFKEASKELEQSIIFIEVWADENIIKDRLQRKREVSDADYAVHLLIKAAFEPLTEAHLSLQSTQDNIDQMLELALKYIQKSHG